MGGAMDINGKWLENDGRLVLCNYNGDDLREYVSLDTFAEADRFNRCIANVGVEPECKAFRSRELERIEKKITQFLSAMKSAAMNVADADVAKSKELIDKLINKEIDPKAAQRQFDRFLKDAAKLLNGQYSNEVVDQMSSILWNQRNKVLENLEEKPDGDDIREDLPAIIDVMIKKCFSGDLEFCESRSTFDTGEARTLLMLFGGYLIYQVRIVQN